MQLPISFYRPFWLLWLLSRWSTTESHSIIIKSTNTSYISLFWCLHWPSWSSTSLCLFQWMDSGMGVYQLVNVHSYRSYTCFKGEIEGNTSFIGHLYIMLLQALCTQMDGKYCKCICCGCQCSNLYANQLSLSLAIDNGDYWAEIRQSLHWKDRTFRSVDLL